MNTSIKNLILLPALITGLGLIPAARVAAQTFTTLHSFVAVSDGASSYAGLITNSSGNLLYGTTGYGGGSGQGTVFRINADGTGFRNLHSFTATACDGCPNSDGASPGGGLILSGNTLYGTAYFGGSSGNGAVFRVNTDGTGFTNLHSFNRDSDGANLQAGLVLSGNTLYGTARYGGGPGNGTVFAVNTDGTDFTNLHSFTPTSCLGCPNSDGASPQAGLILSGNTLYGTADRGGSSGAGTVFAINPDGTGFTNLHSFTAGSGSFPNVTNSDGVGPLAGLISSGNTLYGTAQNGGSSGRGTVFAVNTDGTGFTNLHTFTGISDGANPSAGLFLSGNALYGAAKAGGSSGAGTLFSVNTEGTGFTILHSYTALSGTNPYTNSDGAAPEGGLILSGNTLYGTTFSGGSSGAGTVFSLSLNSNQLAGRCTVDWYDVHQRIDGFGASSAWRSTWTATEADMFFSTNKGIGLSLLRTRIAPDGTSVETTIMQMAQARGARVWSAPWSPPAEFKESGTVNGGPFDSNYNHAYANQLAGYVATMKRVHGINLYAISIQNEPDYDTTSYESCLWTAQQFHDFIPYLYDALAASGVSSTKIMLPESANWPSGTFDLATNSMDAATTSNKVGILAGHAYFSSASPVQSYGKALWQTEVSTFDPHDGGINNGMYWAQQIHEYLTVAEVSAWHYWWLINYNSDNEGLTDQSGNPAKRMYVLGQWSRFVRPNYYRLGIKNNTSALITAFKDPASGKIAIVAVNPNSTPLTQPFDLTSVPGVDAVTPWITSSSLSLASQPPVGTTNSMFSHTLPPQSVMTFVGQSSSPLLTLMRYGTNVIWTWPTNAIGFILQSTTSLVSPVVWSTNSPAPMVVNGQFTVTNLISGPQQFYRLGQ